MTFVVNLVRLVILSHPRAALRLAARYADDHGWVIDEIILVALCLLLLPFAAFSDAHVAAFLCAIVAACCFDVYPHARLRFAAAGAYELAALFAPEFSVLLPDRKSVV